MENQLDGDPKYLIADQGGQRNGVGEKQPGARGREADGERPQGSSPSPYEITGIPRALNCSFNAGRSTRRRRSISPWASVKRSFSTS